MTDGDGDRLEASDEVVLPECRSQDAGGDRLRTQTGLEAAGGKHSNQVGDLGLAEVALDDAS